MGYDPNQPLYEQPSQAPREPLPYTSPEAYAQPSYQPPPSSEPVQPQTPLDQTPYAAPYSARPPHGQSFYGPPGQPPFVAQPPQQKRSLKWLWITLSGLGSLIVLSCIACFLVGGLSFNAIRQAVGPAFVTGEYYQYVQSQQYDKAYALFASNATITVQGAAIPNNHDAYVQAAQLLDQKLGPVSGIKVAQIDSTDLSHITVTVSRGSQAYDVHLTFTGSGSDAKIASIDGI